jgi:2-oxoglutarate ferredoxin oxidoreductase subunit delta
MPSVKIDRDRCKGCELCTFHCPMKILGMSSEINVKGYFFAEVRDPGRCIGCMLCAISCPDIAITVHGNSVQYRTFDYFASAVRPTTAKER